MIQQKIVKWVHPLVIPLLLLTSCTQAKPDWLKKETNVFVSERSFYGVGTLSGTKVKNKVLGQMTADNLAKAAVSNAFESYALSLLNDYTTSLTADQRASLEAEGDLKLTFMTHVAMTLFEVVLQERWRDPDTGTYHALARIKLKHFLREIANAEDLSPEFQDFIKKNAEEAFDRLKALNEPKTEGPTGTEGKQSGRE